MASPKTCVAPPPHTARRNGGEERGEEQQGVGVGGGTPPPLWGRGVPEDQARSIVVHIVNFHLGGGPHSGQSPAAQPQQARHIRRAGGQGSRGRRGKGREGVDRGETGGQSRRPPPAEGENKQRIATRPDRVGWRRRHKRERRGIRRKGTGTERPQGGATVEVIPIGGDATLLEENANLQGFTPEHAYLLLQGFYGDFLHHNYESHLEGGILDDALWQHRWRRLAAQLASWYATPSGAVGRRFKEILAAELWGALDRSWNSERTLAFSHVVLTKTLGVCRAQDIRARITRLVYNMELFSESYLDGRYFCRFLWLIFNPLLCPMFSGVGRGG